jgi:hypothetical protein
MSGWPPLAWIARMGRGDDVVHVFHGSRVEVDGDDRFSEAVWGGDYAAGEFDRTDVVFGSGARIRDGVATFVSSCGTVDRLQSFESSAHAWVSNSLACLMIHVDASVDPTDADYFDFFGTICDGLDKVRRVLATSAGPVRFCYFDNLRWDGQRLAEVTKPHASNGFRSFDEYHAFLQSATNAIAANLSDAARRFPYEMLGTLSSGYDSPAVTTLSARAGLKRAISFVHVKKGVEDTGRDVARVLGLELTLIDRNDFYKDELPEVPFAAADAKGEDVFFSGAKHLLPGAALLTGHHGDRIWDKNCKTVGPYMVRSGRSGLSCSEHRLWVGYQHVALPFIGARRHDDVHLISNSDEMKPWDVGGDYTRPISRRIVEEAGVPRESFGRTKIGSSISMRTGRNLQSASTRADYRRWLRARARDFVRRGRLPPLAREALLAPVQWLARRGWAVYGRLKWLPPWLGFVPAAARRAALFGDRELLGRYVFPWAIEHAKRRYTPAAVPTAAPAPAVSPSAQIDRATVAEQRA